MTLSHWIRKLTNRRITKSNLHASRARHRQRLAVELLEDRLAPAASLLAFTTGPQTIVAGQPSSVITVQLQDQNDQPVQAGAGGVSLNLGSNSLGYISSGGGAFFLDASGNPLPSAAVTIAQGASSVSFEYEDNELGTPTLTAMAPSLGLGATQQETITADEVVTNLNDSGPGSLRDAILTAAPGNTIAFAAGVAGSIQLGSVLPQITSNVNIIGPGSGTLTIDGSLARVVNQGLIGVAPSATVTITDLQVSDGNVTGISNKGSLTLERVIVSYNHASGELTAEPFGNAGGIYNDGALTVTACQIYGNSADGVPAAGIASETGVGTTPTATITDSIIYDNIVNQGAMTLNGDNIQFVSGTPAIENEGTLTVLSCTVANNNGSGIISSGSGAAVTISDSTISNNTSVFQDAAGGIEISGGTLVIANSTVTQNVGGYNDTNTYYGGGIDAQGSSATIFDTIVSGNTSPHIPTDVTGAFTSEGHNWIGAADSQSTGFVASDIVGTVANPKDPGLDTELRYNGGPTPTYALLPSSPAIDAGDNTNAPPADQRGLPRIVNGTIDIGAYEFQIVLSGLPSAQVGVSYGGTGQVINASYGTAPYTFAVTAGALPPGLVLDMHGNINGTPTAGGTFTFTVTATDSTPGAPYSGSQTYTLAVSPPVITFSPAPPGAPVNVAYSQQLTPMGGTAPYSNFTVTAGRLPPGITLSSSGLLQGVPTTIGSYLFTVSVTDSSGGTGPYTFGEQLGIIVTPPGFFYNANYKVLTIDGNAASSEFDYSQASTQDPAGNIHTTYSFTLNGVTLSVPDVLLTSVSVTGSYNQSTAILVANDTYTGNDGQQHETPEIVSVGFDLGQLVQVNANQSTTYFLQLSGFNTVYAYLGRADSGTIDAAPDQIFVSAGGYSYVTGGGLYFEISGASNVYSYAPYVANSTDQAWHYDTAAMDSFVASGNVFSYMSGTDNGQSFFNEAVGFQVTYAVATHGQSYAYLLDSPGNDVFVGYAPYSYMSGSDNTGSLFNVAEGFLIVYGESFNGGTDFAYNYDPQHNVVGGNWILLT